MALHLPPAPNGRTVLLDKAMNLVNGDRNDSYDEPIDNFGRIADLWNIYLAEIDPAVGLQPHDVALLNILQKIARLMHTNDHADSWVDIAGYAACGWDCIVAESLEDPPPTDNAGAGLAEVVPLFPAENKTYYVVSEDTGYPNGVALYHGEHNRQQVLAWLDEHDEVYSPELVRPGFWVVINDIMAPRCMDNDTFQEHYHVALATPIAI